jgi:hypothetical protein
LRYQSPGDIVADDSEHCIIALLLQQPSKLLSILAHTWRHCVMAFTTSSINSGFRTPWTTCLLLCTLRSPLIWLAPHNGKLAIRLMHDLSAKHVASPHSQLSQISRLWAPYGFHSSLACTNISSFLHIFGRSIIPWRRKLLRMDLSVFPIRWDALVM